MKKVILMVFLALFTVQAQAASLWDVVEIIGDIVDVADNTGRSDHHNERFRHRVSCSAKDDGWEEHFGGHSDCRSCMKKHGHCVEVCSSDFYSCKVQGRDYRGYTIDLEGSGRDRYEAERGAMRRCYRNLSNCRLISCKPESEVVSRRRCR